MGVFRRSFESIAATWLAGLLVLLPLALTVGVLAWAFGLVYRLAGPSSAVGRMFAALGYPFSSNPELAYLFGGLLLAVAIWLLGLVVQSGLRGPIKALGERTVRRIPLVRNLYGLADRFVGVLHQQEGADIGAMSPVWCFFGGEGGAAVLALAPGKAPVQIEGRSYRAILIPTAPVPFGGALLYVPVEWVKPGQMGVDGLTAIYVSMGITPPPTRT